MWINDKKGYLQDWITQQWVKATGKRILSFEQHWLYAPHGDTKAIANHFVERLSSKQNLNVIHNKPGFGLIENIDEWQLSEEEKQRLHPEVIAFYENTFDYHFEVWSHWCGAFQPFGWLLSILFSKRLQQLNLPLNPLDPAKGIESNIIKLVDAEANTVKFTIWYRKLKATNHVIYSGVYGTAEVPNFTGKCLKVSFPLPNGSATVIMRITVLEDGSLLLSSNGKSFGDSGFYFTLTNHEGKYWARFVKSMHENIRVYIDEEKQLRADHVLYFYGLRFLHLHYKMTKKGIL
ncbi:MAG: hypothetical protein ICV53_22080 [Flavisolibacter sp.]|nr:hypothetical protein [Flavisolibacter sp.]